MNLMANAFRTLSLNITLLFFFVMPVDALGDLIEINAISTGPGQWVGWSEAPISNDLLKPFVGNYLKAGKWPVGVNRPDQPELLLAREKLSAIRVVAIRAESGGRLIRMTTDPAVSSNNHTEIIGNLRINATFQGFGIQILNEGKSPQTTRIAIPFPLIAEKIEIISEFDEDIKIFDRGWKNPDTNLKLQSWLRLPEGNHDIQLMSGRSFSLEINGEMHKSEFQDKKFQKSIKIESAGIEQEIKVDFPATKDPISEEFPEMVRILKNGDQTNIEKLTAAHFLVPWAPESVPEATVAIAPPPYELTGGNVNKGREIFNSQTAKCANCHAIEGQGGKIGPDLTGLNGKDPSLVFHHINAPSERIHPGYPSFTVGLKNGQVAMGVVRSIAENELEVVDTDAKSLKFSVHEVEEIKPSTSSIMPQGLAGTLGEGAMRDLIAFLTQPKQESK
jgi:putative heme-binding domain-containing protein